MAFEQLMAESMRKQDKKRGKEERKHPFFYGNQHDQDEKAKEDPKRPFFYGNQHDQRHQHDEKTASGS